MAGNSLPAFIDDAAVEQVALNIGLMALKNLGAVMNILLGGLLINALGMTSRWK
jgi:hypothetical protein